MGEALADGAVAVARHQKTPRSSAQQRLLDAVTHAAGSEGYSDLTVERVLEVAGVSRASFYQYFSSLDDCFVDAYRQHAEKLTGEIARAVGKGESGESALLRELIGLASRDPDAARVLAIEGLATGRAGLRERESLVSSIERTMAAARRRETVLDLPASVLVGGALRFIGMRLAGGGGITETALAESLEWTAAFSRRAARPCWSARLAPVPIAESPDVSRAFEPRGTVGTARERLLYAAAATIKEKGYRAVAVTDIVAAAGVSRRSFYNQFANKADVVIAASEHAFARTIETCTPAFFSARVWPERVWRCALAFTGFFSSEPLLAHLGFVDCYAVGRTFVKRVHEMQLAFTLFLEEGYRQRKEARELPRMCSEMTAASMMELGFLTSIGPVRPPIRRLQPLAVYIVLTPFMGPDAAGNFVLGNL
jgi:TetR/AcrR family transcriptional regulator